MSRCFPFPPPGYEKKARTDEVDLLKKEKHREKKHKKEDKEKREGKEKREKDRSDGKHREKKDKKEKHGDKKDKEKERGKDKDKKGISDENRLSGKSEDLNGEKLIQKGERDKDKKNESDEKRFTGQFAGYNGEKISQNIHLAEETKNSKFVQELGRRVSDDVRGSGNQLVDKFTVAGHQKDAGTVGLLAKGSGTRIDGKEKNKDKRANDRKIDTQGIKDEAKFGGNAMVENSAGLVQTRVGMPKPQQKVVDKSMEGTEKTREKETDDKRGEKRKDKDRDKKSRGKDKERDKEKKKEEKAKEKSEQKNIKQDKSKESSKNDLILTHTIKTPLLPTDSSKSAVSEGNLRKRKDPETNGILQVNDIRPNKLPRPTTSSHSITENGGILEPCIAAIPISSDGQGTVNNRNVNSKESKLNGVVDTQPLSASTSKPLSATAQVDQKIVEASVRPPHPDSKYLRQGPPHPDSKYLRQILSVPKMEEVSNLDDQEWLFSSNKSKSNKSKVGSSEVNETPQVWAEALRIESADVYALPYVIPY